MIDFNKFFLISFLLICGFVFYYGINKYLGAGVFCGLFCHLLWKKDKLF